MVQTAEWLAQLLVKQLHQAISKRATRRGASLKLLARNVAKRAGGWTFFDEVRTKNGLFHLRANELLSITKTLHALAISFARFDTDKWRRSSRSLNRASPYAP